jgi:hypothetical protein
MINDNNQVSFERPVYAFRYVLIVADSIEVLQNYQNDEQSKQPVMDLNRSDNAAAISFFLDIFNF